MELLRACIEVQLGSNFVLLYYRKISKESIWRKEPSDDKISMVDMLLLAQMAETITVPILVCLTTVKSLQNHLTMIKQMQNDLRIDEQL